MGDERMSKRLPWGWALVAVVAVGGVALWQGQNKAGAQQSNATNTVASKEPHISA